MVHSGLVSEAHLCLTGKLQRRWQLYQWHRHQEWELGSLGRLLPEHPQLQSVPCSVMVLRLPVLVSVMVVSLKLLLLLLLGKHLPGGWQLPQPLQGHLLQ